MSLQVWMPLTLDLRNLGISTNKATNSGATFLSSGGKLGGCYKSDGEARFTIPTYPWMTLRPENSFSVALWEKGTATSTTTYIFACTAFELRVLNSTIYVGWGGAANEPARYNATISDSTWYHIAFTWDGPTKTLKLYINGTLQGTSNVTGSVPTSISSNLYCTYNGTRYLNDLRIYNHCLTPQEIKEISKGLVAHYTLGSADVYEATTNKFTYPTPGSAVGAIGWDQSLHSNAVYVSGWTSGYNSGVADPSTVYHAMWNVIDGIPTMVFLDLNSTKGHTHSWEGISGGTTDASLFTSGRKYTVSFTARSTVNGGAITCGLYYKRNSSESNNFYDGCPLTNLTTSWKRYSITFTSQGANSVSSFYFYGHDGNEGIKYVRDVQLELLDHDTPYVKSSRSTGLVYDSSGYCKNASISGTLTPGSSPRYDQGLDGFAAGNRIVMDNALQALDKCTYSFWCKGSGFPFWGNNNSLIMLFPTNKILIYATNTAGTAYGWSSKDFNHNTTDWYHIAVVYDGSNIKVYVNGTDSGHSLAVSGSLASVTQAFGGWSSNYYWTGSMSDIRVYATALSADDISDLYKLGASIS